ncbi:hypothetical protein LAZ67_2002935 [Cordylochernes scorpioides]|uniref:Uncharacterized protein n=1 Tax=Cordylochernes scorpioides TaxID=51811 RepID=A0ABY6K423_9ARAC|nr:hypothetical protein LAZ67_2002935 [Cordylochernes scorpioides]
MRQTKRRMMPKFPRKKNNNNIREIAQRHCKVKLKLTRNQKCAGAIVSTPAVADRRRPPMPIVAAVIPFSGFHCCVKAKTSLQDDDVPIDDTMTKPLFTLQEKGRKGTKDNVPRLR